MTQSAVPVHDPSPDQPTKYEPAPGDACSVTDVPYEKLWKQVPPQSIPLGVLVTVPVPTPSRDTLRSCGIDVSMLKVAVTACAASIVTTQSAVPEQPAPDHPAKSDPDAGFALRVTTVPSSKSLLQVSPQSMPAGELVTDPAPPPSSETSSACWGLPTVTMPASAV